MLKQTAFTLCLLSVLNLSMPVWANTSDSSSQWLQIQEPTLDTVIYLSEKPSSDTEKTLHYPDSAWVASFVPGLGQIIMDEPLRGAAFMGGFVAAFPAGFGIGYGIGRLQPPPQPRPSAPGVINLSGLDFRGLSEGIFGALILGIGIYIWNLTDAYGLNMERNRAFYKSLQQDSLSQINWQVSKF